MTTITIDNAILEQALDAHILSLPYIGAGYKTAHTHDTVQASISALRAALAAQQPAPAWHDAPTVPGLWVDGINLRVLRFNDPDIGHIWKGRWLGPLPEDTK